MYIENGANKLVHYCATLARIMNEDNISFKDMWAPVLDEVNARLPSGSGSDSGSRFDVDASKPGRLVFKTSFHHMDGYGYYDGWTEHLVIVTPSFEHGFEIRVTGRNKNEIKDYIAEQFQEVLSDYVKTTFCHETRTMGLAAAMYDYGFEKTAA